MKLRLFRPLSNMLEESPPTSPSSSMVFTETGTYFPPQNVLTELWTKLDKMAATRQGGFVHVEGLAGIGKSRLGAYDIRCIVGDVVKSS
jgi:hypothetical protein